MSFRIIPALTLAAALAAAVHLTAWAKGGFSFITVSGPGLPEPVRISQRELTLGFFTFANFYEDRTTAPADPGEGYEITRFYLDGSREQVFDQLHYYPASGLVYYDGIVNGSSEYDDQWYAAQPGIRAVFDRIVLGTGNAAAPFDSIRPGAAIATSAEKPWAGSPPIAILAVVITALAATTLYVVSRRRPLRR